MYIREHRRHQPSMVYVLAFAIDKKKEGSFFHPLHSQRTATKLEGYRATSNGSVSEWLGMPGIGRNFHVIIILLGGKAPKTAPSADLPKGMMYREFWCLIFCIGFSNWNEHEKGAVPSNGT